MLPEPDRSGVCRTRFSAPWAPQSLSGTWVPAAPSARWPACGEGGAVSPWWWWPGFHTGGLRRLSGRWAGAETRPVPSVSPRGAETRRGEARPAVVEGGGRARGLSGECAPGSLCWQKSSHWPQRGGDLKTFSLGTVVGVGGGDAGLKPTGTCPQSTVSWGRSHPHGGTEDPGFLRNCLLTGRLCQREGKSTEALCCQMPPRPFPHLL